MVDPRIVERLWYGDDPAARAARAALWPAERLFGAAVGLRDLLYDAGWLRTEPTAIPAISVGNLSVGGTGTRYQPLRSAGGRISTQPCGLISSLPEYGTV